MRVALLTLLAACGPVEPCPNGSMLDGPGGLQLVQSEHELGWGQSDCWHCHVQENIHKLGCTDGVDLQAVQEQVEAEGLAACSACHGDNGTGGSSSDTGSSDTGSNTQADQ